ncbi:MULTISPECIES: hypothetical protein [Aerococcus]|uniref:hypothetical protein n=1 Tax=Aerococcus TaxID=1375 RepID=UPI000DCAFFC5|nr:MULTISPECIES: hypothetical protein [Aerococcus]KAA9232825.1 hypothetical protein F6I37_07105 [Aerococcus mictus]MDK6292538.1 hypothetical protein [Aerococcus urinae]MDK6374781.1 hypothetical protein [Aerococcus urinae]MDK6420194.1 hypothetical protein [Aerococcus urinae]MDK8074656.1 hypothetical protein [Aerococcus urinae]
MAKIKEEYQVMSAFHDKTNTLKAEPKGRLYKEGDLFPAVNLEVSDERIDMLVDEGFIAPLDKE